jgi:adenine-specific DNA-methyltransferase
LKAIFPNIVTEGKIDIDKLRLMLGEEVDDSMEKYQFMWKGKNKAIKLAQTPSTATLRPSKEDSENWDTTENLYIEGDNLEVLKQLQKTYFGKIKMIYIDPPYNTGGDFVYKDDFKDSIKNYKEQTNQTSSSNPDTSGRYHTDWLNMMYPRLLLSKNLLTEDGAIFISIDENEMENLKKICDEIYGENNHLGTLIWENRTAPNDSGSNFGVIHEYLLIYSKRPNNFSLKGIEKDFSNYKNPDNDPNGPWIKDNPSAASGSEADRFPIINPYTGENYYPPRGRYWAFSEKRVSEWLSSGKLVFPKVKNKNFILKKYKNELKSMYNPFQSIFRGYLTMHGTKEFKELFSEGSELFKYPKPTDFIKALIAQVREKDFIVLDFFSGSGTTAAAVIQLNALDGGKRKFIMVQLPEKIDEKATVHKVYDTICEVGKERIRRVGKKIQKELKEKKEKAGMLNDNITSPDQLDIGFKVFKLDETNLKIWDSSIEVENNTLLSQIEIIKNGRSREDVLYEILLKYGVFDEVVKKLVINGKSVYGIAEKYMIINLNDSITIEDIKGLADIKPSVVILLESGFNNDNQKINAEATLKHQGINEIKFI